MIVSMGGECLAGSERSLVEFLRACREQVSAFVLSDSHVLLEAVRQAGAVGEYCNLAVMSPYGDHPWNFGGFCRSVRRLVECVNRFCPHLIHANSLCPTQLAVIAGLLRRLPVVCHIRLEDFRRTRELALSRWADAVIAVSEAVARPHRAMWAKRPVHVVHDPVSVPTIDALGVRGRRDSRLRMAVAARLSPEKGVDRAVRFMAWLRSRGIDASLAVYGSGPMLGELTDLAASEGIRDRLHFEGFVDDLPERLAAADVLLVPSRSEGLGRVVVEAGLLGVPSIATRLGGLPETMVDGTTGILVDDFESDLERERMLALLGDRALLHQMGDAARDFCARGFAPSVAAASTLSVYKEILDAKARTSGFRVRAKR